jgi:hypothetical protein
MRSLPRVYGRKYTTCDDSGVSFPRSPRRRPRKISALPRRASPILKGTTALTAVFRYIKNSAVPGCGRICSCKTPRSAGKAIFVLRIAQGLCTSNYSRCRNQNSASKRLPWHLRIAVSAHRKPQGLYHPRNEHDACGMGLVASIKRREEPRDHPQGLEVLINLTHRGAAGCDPETGDGAGILIQIPHAFFARECGELGMQLPEPGAYGVAMCFLPVERTAACSAKASSSALPRKRADRSRLARHARQRRRHRPRSPRLPALHRAAFRRPPGKGLDEDAFERLLYRVRRRTENEIAASEIEDKETFYVPRSPAAPSSTRA